MSRRTLLLAGGAAALLLAIGGGYGVARLTDPHTAAAPAPAEHEEAEGDHVALTPAQAAASGITIVAVGRGGGGETRLSGRVEAAVDARAPVSALVEGRIERLLVAPGQRVRAGQVVAVLVSPDAATLRADADAAAASADAARAAWERDNRLHGQGWIATQRLDVTRAERVRAEAVARAARARADAAGSPDPAGRISVRSPIGGIVLDVPGAPGGFVEAGARIAEVSDPSRVELVFQSPPALAALVKPGDELDVEAPAGRFRVVVVGVAADVREASGATVIRARPVGGAALPPAGSAVTGSVVSGGDSAALTVPAEAVQTVEGRTVVFLADGQGFRPVPVRAGREAGGHIEILEGLSGGERIAGPGAFLLKAELAKGDAGHGH